MAKRTPSQVASLEMRRAYYQVLQAEDATFREKFRALFGSIFPAVVKSLTAQQRLDEIRESDRRGATKKDRTRVQAFARRWHLPQDAEHDIWDSFYPALIDEPLCLWATLPNAPLVCLAKRKIKLDSFLYDPRRDPEASVDQYLQAVRELLIRRAQAERAVSYKQFRRQQLPAPLWHRAHVRMRALRLYRRVVLNWTWTKIAEAEGPGTSAKTVRVSVRAWAKALGVPLPSARPGRPRLHKIAVFHPR